MVYTDNRAYLEKYLPSSVEYKELSDNQIIKWRGNINFVHRIKIEMLINFCSNYDGNVLYLDTDTIFTQSPDCLFNAINNDILVMHTNEGRMSYTRNRVFDKMLRFLNNKKFEIDKKSIRFSKDQQMWNAGVIGLKSNRLNLLNNVLNLTDSLYSQYKKHIIEQFAFSYEFTQSELIVAAENCIFHYWNFKEFRQTLNEYLQEQDSFEKVKKNFQTINPIQLIKPKMNFELLPHIVQQFKKYITRQKWYLPRYSELKDSSKES